MNIKYTARTFEQSVFAQDEQMQNVHGAMKNSIKLAGLTVKNYTESDIKKMEIAVQRYADKPNLMMQWAQESNNGLSPQLHSKFMDTIEKFYAKWEMTQKNKISVVQEYRKWLYGSIKGDIATSMYNFPSQKATVIMDRIISSKETKSTWQSGEDTVEDPFK